MIRLSALSLVAATAAAVDVALTINATMYMHEVSENYVCFNIDTGSIFNGFDFTNTKLINLVKGLAPTIVRVGGTAADYAKYLPSSPARSEGTSVTIISDATWDTIVAFSKGAGVQLLWDFNGLSYRDGSNHWNPALNATAFLAYTNSKYAGTQFLWSVSNEPDLWPGTKPTGAQLAFDSQTLKSTLAQYNVGTEVYGPSYAGFNADSAAYFRGSKGTAGYTSHNYPLARNCNIVSTGRGGAGRHTGVHARCNEVYHCPPRAYSPLPPPSLRSRRTLTARALTSWAVTAPPWRAPRPPTGTLRSCSSSRRRVAATAGGARTSRTGSRRASGTCTPWAWSAKTATTVSIGEQSGAGGDRWPGCTRLAPPRPLHTSTGTGTSRHARVVLTSVPATAASAGKTLRGGRSLVA